MSTTPQPDATTDASRVTLASPRSSDGIGTGPGEEKTPSHAVFACDGVEHDLPSELTLQDCEPWVPPIVGGRVVKVYDGDTITVASRMPGLRDSPIYKFSVRLRGIDTPELRTKDMREKAAAVVARDALAERIMGRDVHLREVGVEKYGRLLADVCLGDECMNAWLLENHYGVAYMSR